MENNSDSFLMGFSNVDVVLAFEGNHAKSFKSNFPSKKTNHRCMRAFEVSLLDPQPGIPSRDTQELYIMGIQKTKRGAYHGRSDRKKSYKVCDLGMLIGKKDDGGRSGRSNRHDSNINNKTDDIQFDTVEGRMFGFTRNGHYRLLLDRKKNKSLVVMPISFGHPAASDKDTPFVLRFVSDMPLLIRELPSVPRMDMAMQRFCLESSNEVAPWNNSLLYNDDPWFKRGRQGTKRILLDDGDNSSLTSSGESSYRIYFIDCLANGGGTAFVYLCVNGDLIKRRSNLASNGVDISFSVEVNCRGMMCRTEDGLLVHETVSKGKKFEAAWRRFKCDFYGEQKSRLLMVLFQSGQDTEMGSIKCERINHLGNATNKQQSIITERQSNNTLNKYWNVEQSKISKPAVNGVNSVDDYPTRGIFNPTSRSFLPRSAFARNDVQKAASLVRFAEENSSTFIDVELEQAIQRSRRDAISDARCADGACRENSRFAAEDQDLERAIRASMKEQNAPPSSASTNHPSTTISSSNNNTFSQELDKAIRISLQDQKSTLARGGNDDGNNTKKSNSDDNEHENAKRKAASNDEVIEIIDSTPQHCTYEGDTSKQSPIDLAQKRKLAAEAAVKRFKSSKANAELKLV